MICNAWYSVREYHIHLSGLQADGLVREGGYFYTSFKHGDFEGERNGRFFVDFTLESWEAFVADVDGLELVEYWYTADVRPGREDEKWLNVIMRKYET